MQTTCVTSGPLPANLEAVCIQTEAPPKVVYVTTAPQPPPPSTTIVVVNNNGSVKVLFVSFFLFVYGGMDLARSLDSNLLTSILYMHSSLQFFYGWFIGFIVGALLACATVTHVPKIVFYVLCSTLELIDGILYVSSNEYSCLLAARYVGGAGIGILTVVYIIHSAEVSVSGNRGSVTGLEQSALALGVAFEVIYGIIWEESIGSYFNLFHGIVGILFALISFLYAIFNTIESPVFHLRRNHEAKALECQQKNLATNQAAVRALNEAKRYVKENEDQSLGQQIGDSLMPFIKLLLVRCFVAFSISFPLVISIQVTSEISMRTYEWPFIVWALLRLIGAFISLSVLDKLCRKAVTILALFCMAVLMLTMAILYGTLNTSNYVYDMGQLSNLGMAFQFFAGLYLCSSTTYLSEAFPMRVKPFFIALVVCFEQLIHIIVIVCFSVITNYFFHYFLAVSIILMLGCVLLAAMLPETRQTTLRQAGERFRQTFYLKMQ